MDEATPHAFRQGFAVSEAQFPPSVALLVPLSGMQPNLAGRATARIAHSGETATFFSIDGRSDVLLAEV